MKMIAICVFAVLLSACASVGHESLINKSDDWPTLDMTKAQLLAELGPPQANMRMDTNGQITESLTWIYGHAESNPALFIPIVGFFVAASGEGMSVSSRGLTVSFINGKMTSRAWSQYQIGHGQQAVARP